MSNPHPTSAAVTTTNTLRNVATIPAVKPPLGIYTTVDSCRAFRRPLITNNKSLGFVPTMGALHQGHLSLVRTAAAENDVVAVSIFVNPAQFSPTEDLEVYPRTLTSDIALLESVNADLVAQHAHSRIAAVFLPTVADLYPAGIPRDEARQRGAFVTVQPLASKLEGISRPHFFRGVSTVCAKLFNIIQPDRVYFGQKDVQQTVIIRRMVRDLAFPIDVRVGPTAREHDGLAMSSRNIYLGAKRRAVAPVLFQALRASEEAYSHLSTTSPTISASTILAAGLSVLKAGIARGSLDESIKVEVEYFSLTDNEELEDLDVVDVSKGGILSAAIKMLPSSNGENVVRMIDNIILHPRSKNERAFMFQK